MRLFHPVADIFPSMGEEEYQELKNDIVVNGVREPITTWHGQIIDGRHRARVCDEIGVDCPSQEFFGPDPLTYVISLNLHRRHLSESQRAMVAANLAILPVGSNQHASIEAPSQRSAAAMLNVSRSAIQRAAIIRDDGASELKVAVKSGLVSVAAGVDIATLPKEEQVEIVARGEIEILQAAKRIRADRTAQTVARNDDIRREAASAQLPTGIYRTVIIDPPWPMEIIDRDVRPGQVGMHYPTMSLDEIRDIKLPLADDATVFLWTTQRFLPDAFSVLQAWGLKYLVTMVWHKPGGPQPYNLPQYNCEFALIGRRGSPLFLDTKQFFTCFDAPRREHSRKPDEFYDLVRRVCPGDIIDWFAREKRDGIEAYGAESDKFSTAA